MAGQEEPVIDATTGTFLTGRFAGRKVSEVADYAVALEEEFEKVKPAPAATAAETKPKPAVDPNAALSNEAGSRVMSVLTQTTNRLEAEDEAAFAESVEDYEKYREKVKALKSSMTPEARLQRGLHETLYWNLKMQEPEFKAKMRGQPVAATTGDNPPVETPPAEVPPVAPPAPVVPRAVPPVSAPPSPRRDAPPPKKEDTLVAPDKLAKAAKAWGMPVEDYLQELKNRGMTQEDVDRETSSREERRAAKPYNRSVYDRS